MNIIERLNSITLEDIKKLDKEQIKEFIIGRPEISVNILLIALTLYATIFIYNSDKKKAQEFRKQAVELKEKLKVVKRSDELRLQYQSFLNAFPESINIDELSNKLSEFAVANNVQILFFTPGGKIKTDFKEITNIKIRISSGNYANIIYFIKQIEESNFNISIERWYGESVRQVKTEETEDDYAVQVEANIELILYSLVNA